MRKELLLVGCLLLTGCPDLFGKKDAHPGTDLGSFHVKANAMSNTCGEGALGQSDAWEFDVKLSRGDTELFWDNGQEVITGTLATDKVTFSFDSGVEVDMRAGMPKGLPKCVVHRTDASNGALDSKTNEVMGFSGALSYAFAPVAGSDCDDLVHGDRPVLAALPCQLQYNASAARTKAPTTPAK